MKNIKFNMKKQRWICVVTDWFTTGVAFFFFNIYRYFHLHVSEGIDSLSAYLLSTKMILEQIFVPMLLLAVYWLSGYYNKPFQRSRLSEFLVTLYSQIFNAIIIYLGALTNDQLMMRRENWMLILILFFLLFIFTYTGRFILTNNVIQKFKKQKYAYKTVIVGAPKRARYLAEKLNNSKSTLGYEIVGFLPFGFENNCHIQANHTENYRIIPDLESLKQLIENGGVDQVIIAPSRKNNQTDEILNALYHFFPYDISIRIEPDQISYITPSIKMGDILDEPFIDLSSPHTDEFSKNIKRTLDVILSSIALITLSPVFAGIAIFMKLSSREPVFYSQERIGYHRKPFKIYKFRSMVVNAESNGPQLSCDDDPRITPFGKWMRKYRIDELPQFWNVLKGDMSIVGPRPEREYYIDEIIKTAPWYSLIHQVRPGITSWGMVKFGYASTVPDMIERNRFDLVYLSNMSVVVDFKILLHTLNTVFRGKGK